MAKRRTMQLGIIKPVSNNTKAKSPAQIQAEAIKEAAIEARRAQGERLQAEAERTKRLIASQERMEGLRGERGLQQERFRGLTQLGAASLSRGEKLDVDRLYGGQAGGGVATAPPKPTQQELRKRNINIQQQIAKSGEISKAGQTVRLANERPATINGQVIGSRGYFDMVRKMRQQGDIDVSRSSVEQPETQSVGTRSGQRRAIEVARALPIRNRSGEQQRLLEGESQKAWSELGEQEGRPGYYGAPSPPVMQPQTAQVPTDVTRIADTVLQKYGGAQPPVSPQPAAQPPQYPDLQYDPTRDQGIAQPWMKPIMAAGRAGMTPEQAQSTPGPQAAQIQLDRLLAQQDALRTAGDVAPQIAAGAGGLMLGGGGVSEVDKLSISSLSQAREAAITKGDYQQADYIGKQIDAMLSKYRQGTPAGATPIGQPPPISPAEQQAKMETSKQIYEIPRPDYPSSSIIWGALAAPFRTPEKAIQMVAPTKQAISQILIGATDKAEAAKSISASPVYQEMIKMRNYYRNVAASGGTAVLSSDIATQLAADLTGIEAMVQGAMIGGGGVAGTPIAPQLPAAVAPPMSERDLASLQERLRG